MSEKFDYESFSRLSSLITHCGNLTSLLPTNFIPLLPALRGTIILLELRCTPYCFSIRHLALVTRKQIKNFGQLRLPSQPRPYYGLFRIVNDDNGNLSECKL